MAVARFKQDFSPITVGGGGRMSGGSVSRMYRPGNFNEPGISRQFRPGEYLKFQRRLRGGPAALWRGLAGAGAYLEYEYGKFWDTPWVTTSPGLDPSGWRFPGFTLDCVQPDPVCTVYVGNSYVPLPPNVLSLYGCPSPVFHCQNWGSVLPISDPSTMGAVQAFGYGPYRNSTTATTTHVWTAPVPTVAALPVGFTFPLEGPLEWEAPRPDFALAPRPMRRPWLDRDPAGRPHPLADHVPALELRFPARRGTASAGARRGAVRHYQRPDRAKKGRGGLPRGMARALMLFHAATELKDFIDAMYDAVPRWRRRGVGNGWFERLEAIAANWDAFLEPEVAQDAVGNLLENEVEDRVIGRLFGASWGLGRGRLQDQYASTSWVDAAGNDPYGSRDTVMGLDGSPTEAFPWNR